MRCRKGNRASGGASKEVCVQLPRGAAKQACVAQTCSARCGRLGLPARRLYGLYRLACGANPIYTVVLIVVDERLMLHTHQLSVAWSVVDVTWL